jgi:hypothetical protein
MGSRLVIGRPFDMATQGHRSHKFLHSHLRLVSFGRVE